MLTATWLRKRPQGTATVDAGEFIIF